MIMSFFFVLYKRSRLKHLMFMLRNDMIVFIYRVASARTSNACTCAARACCPPASQSCDGVVRDAYVLLVPFRFRVLLLYLFLAAPKTPSNSQLRWSQGTRSIGNDERFRGRGCGRRPSCRRSCSHRIGGERPAELS